LIPLAAIDIVHAPALSEVICFCVGELLMHRAVAKYLLDAVGGVKRVAPRGFPIAYPKIELGGLGSSAGFWRRLSMNRAAVYQAKKQDDRFHICFSMKIMVRPKVSCANYMN